MQCALINVDIYMLYILCYIQHILIKYLDRDQAAGTTNRLDVHNY